MRTLGLLVGSSIALLTACSSSASAPVEPGCEDCAPTSPTTPSPPTAATSPRVALPARTPRVAIALPAARAPRAPRLTPTKILDATTSITCSSTYYDETFTFTPLATCAVTVDGIAYSCATGADGTCTIALPPTDTATATIGLGAFDPNDAALPADKTCEADFGLVNRSGGLAFSPYAVCATNPGMLPSATRSTLLCHGTLTTFAATPAGAVFENGALDPCQLSLNGTIASCSTAGGPSCNAVMPVPSVVEFVDPALDPFGNPTQAKCRSRSWTYWLIAGGGLVETEFSETCDSDPLTTLASNADPSRQTTAPAGSSPQISWSADASLGTCQVTAFDVQPGPAYTPSTFISAAGSTGDQPSDQPLLAAGDEKLVVLTCTNAAGAIAQKGVGVLAQ